MFSQPGRSFASIDVENIEKKATYAENASKKMSMEAKLGPGRGFIFFSFWNPDEKLVSMSYEIFRYISL